MAISQTHTNDMVLSEQTHVDGSVDNNTTNCLPPIDKASTSHAKDSTVYLFSPIMYQPDDYRNLKDQMTTLTSVNTTHLGRKKRSIKI